MFPLVFPYEDMSSSPRPPPPGIDHLLDVTRVLLTSSLSPALMQCLVPPWLCAHIIRQRHLQTPAGTSHFLSQDLSVAPLGDAYGSLPMPDQLKVWGFLPVGHPGSMKVGGRWILFPWKILICIS